MNDRFKIETISKLEARYKQTSGLKLGIPTGIRVEDLKQGLIVISLNERSQLGNKEKCIDVLRTYELFGE